MTDHKYRCIIGVKAARKNAANNFWKNNIDRVGGEDTFTVALSASGDPPATWYISTMLLEEWQLAKIVEIADANTTDIRIVIWPHRKGVRQKLLDKMDGRANITIANGEQSPKQFLLDSNLKILKPNGI